jgi:hypothetical protein
MRSPGNVLERNAGKSADLLGMSLRWQSSAWWAATLYWQQPWHGGSWQKLSVTSMTPNVLSWSARAL